MSIKVPNTGGPGIRSRGLRICACLLTGMAIQLAPLQVPAQSEQALGSRQLERILELERQHRPQVAIPAERVIEAFRAAGFEVSHLQQAPAVATGGDYALAAWVRQGALGLSIVVYEFGDEAKLERFRQTMELTHSMNPGADVGDYAINHTTALQVMALSAADPRLRSLRQRLLEIFRRLSP